MCKKQCTITLDCSGNCLLIYNVSDFKRLNSIIFILPDLKNRVSLKNNGKISVSRSFLDPIKNHVSVKSVYVEAVYLEALL